MDDRRIRVFSRSRIWLLGIPAANERAMVPARVLACIPGRFEGFDGSPTVHDYC